MPTLLDIVPMSANAGWTITLVYLILAILIVITKLILRYPLKNKWETLQNTLLLVLALLPASFMFLIGDRWNFDPSYLPTNNPVVDLTYSSFHIFFIIWMIVLAIVFVFIAKSHREDQSKTYFKGRMNKVDFTIFRIGLFLLSIELYKQLIFAGLWHGIDNYQWYAFPLQFCSVPIFFFLIAPWLKNQKLKSATYEFIGLFVTLAGLLVMIVGGDVFVANVSISVHTMLWHSMMVVAGVYLIAAKRIGTDYKQLIRASVFLVGLIIFVQIVNIHFHFMGAYIENGPSNFSGFFISPWESGYRLPVLGLWQKALYESPMPLAISAFLFSLIYFLAFTVGASLVYGLCYGTNRLIKVVQNRKSNIKTVE